MRYATLVFLATTVLATPAWAVDEDADCRDLDRPVKRDAQGVPLPPSASDILICGRQLVNRESLLHVYHHIQGEVADRLLNNHQTPEPAGLALDEKAARERLKGDREIAVIPTADVTEAPAVRKWNTWIDGKATFIETEDLFGNTDGVLFNGLAGADYKLADNFVIGLMGTFEASDLDTNSAAPQTTRTNGWGGGVYAGLSVGENIVLSATVAGAAVNTDVSNAGASADIDSQRLQISGGATGYFFFGDTRWSPILNVAYSKEWQDAYVDTAGAAAGDQTFEAGILSLGGQIGHTFRGEGAMSVEPWVGAQLDYTFLDRVTETGKADINADGARDIRLQAGFNVSFAENVQLGILGEASGLVISPSEGFNRTYAIDAILSWQF